MITRYFNAMSDCDGFSCDTFVAGKYAIQQSGDAGPCLYELTGEQSEIHLGCGETCSFNPDCCGRDFKGYVFIGKTLALTESIGVPTVTTQELLNMAIQLEPTFSELKLVDQGPDLVFPDWLEAKEDTKVEYIPAFVDIIEEGDPIATAENNWNNLKI